MPRQPLPLHDGGPLYHPEQPLGFHPALRAAGHLLVAGEAASPGLAASLREEVLPLHPPTGRHLASPRLRIDPDGNARLFHHARVGASGEVRSPACVRSTLDYLEALRGWAVERYLESPFVLEVLLLTLAAWFQHGRRAALAEADRQALRRAGVGVEGLPPAPPALPSPPWGPWVEVLTRDPGEADVGAVLDLTPRMAQLHLGSRPARELAAVGLFLELRPWYPDLESWEERQEALREEVEAVLARHREATWERYRAAGYEATPSKTAAHHFGWLAQRQLHGRRPSELARRSGVTATAVRGALAELGELLELPLRRVRRGPAAW